MRLDETFVLMTEKQKKKIEVDLLFTTCNFPETFSKFYDVESEKLLDMKEEVLTKLKNGVPYSKIPHFYDILELYPGDETRWD